jgi:hypothetical protein
MTAQAIIPNVALGRVNELINRVNDNDPANAVVVIVLCEVGDSAANLRDFDNLSALLAGASTESAFTNYARVVLDDGDIVAPVVDDSGNQQTWELADQTPLIASAGGAVNQDIDQIILNYDPDSTGGADTAIIPFHVTNDDGGAALQTTNGSDLDLTSPTPTFTAEQA